MTGLSRQRSFLITGATSGIGAAVAERFTCEGYSVLGMQRRDPGIQVDLSDVSAISAAWHAALLRLGTCPDLVILNAGQSLGGPFQEATDEQLLHVLNLDLVAPLLLAREAIRSWSRDESQGHLIFIGSQGALPGARQIGNVIYSACKAALHGVVGPLAHECGPRVRVNAIAPGDVATPLAESALARRSALTGCNIGDLRDEVARKSPLQRWVLPREIAEAAVFLDSCEAMNGAILNVSAGSSIH